jgi:glycosyltransferase involved in cell wall biosynthesis
MLVVSLVTLGSPEQLTGGYLYHRRMADLAARHDARVDFTTPGRWHLAVTGGDQPSHEARVVLVDSIAAAFVAPRLWRRAPVAPLAAVLHQPPGGIDHRAVRRRLQAPVDRWVYGRCRLLIAASAALGDELVAEHGVRPDALVVIPPGRDVAARRGRGGTLDLRRGRRAAFVAVGNWMARKGILELLDAFARLPPGDATLHLAGRDDVEARYARRVWDRLAAPDLHGRVVVHGRVSLEAVADLYANADAFVLASYREPYGTVYGEALGAGLPVVGWRAGNLPHLARDGVEGVLVDPGDIPGLAEALARLAVEPGWRRQLAEGARRRGESLPTWTETATSFFESLRRIAPDTR